MEEEGEPPAQALEHMPSHNVLLFGSASELDGISLPTSFDILKYYFFLGDQWKKGNKMFSYKTFTPKVVDKLLEIWGKLKIDLVKRLTVTKKLNTLIDKYKQLNKCGQYSHKFKLFVDGTKEIFYIAECKCSLKSNRCNCGKIPDDLKDFMFDQHNERKLTIPIVEDPTETEVSTIAPTLQSSGDETYQPTPSELQDDIAMEMAETSVESLYSPRYSIPKFAMICDRFGVSNRVASCLASALFEDIAFKDERGQTVVCDKNKIERERAKLRTEVLRQRQKGCLEAFSFDGRKNDALTREKIDEVYHSRMQKESHLVVVHEPNSKLLGYVNLEGKGESAEAKQAALNAFFQEKELPLDNLIGICSDGEVTNTGTERGILRRFELQLKRPLHWWICLLHFNELPFRNLWNALEKSQTTGPRTATGVLAKEIQDCHTLQVLITIKKKFPISHIIL